MTYFGPLPVEANDNRDWLLLWLRNQTFPIQKTSGPWLDWTPSFTNITIGNGAYTARYSQIGGWVFFDFTFTLGSESAIGSIPKISQPVTQHARYDDPDHMFGDCRCRENGGTVWYGGTYLVDGTNLAAELHKVTAATSDILTSAAISATIPFTWGTSDELFMAGMYEGA